MKTPPRYARVSHRGRWHDIVRLIPRTARLQTACGRVLPPEDALGLEASRAAAVAGTPCAKCFAARRT